MPHLDDGQIAEWIDSADRRDDATAEREVAEHLRECAVCRERVVEARRVEQRARAILGHAAPAVTDTPPFDVVLARAGRAAPRRTSTAPWRWLAWAATVVIAGGLGWFARGQSLQPHAAPTPAERAVAVLDSAAPLVAVQPEQRTGAVGGAAAAAPAPERPRVAAEPPAQREEKQLARADQPAAVAKAAATREADEQLRDTGARGAVAGVAAPPAAAPAPSPSRNALESGVTEEALTWRSVPRATAERVLGGPVATVPDLPVTRYEVLLADALVRVVQTLPSGTPLELLETSVTTPAPTSADARRSRVVAASERVQAVASAQDSVTLDGVRVTARAEVSPDSLKVLLGKVRR
jgi:hypothetical protein